MFRGEPTPDLTLHPADLIVTVSASSPLQPERVAAGQTSARGVYCTFELATGGTYQILSQLEGTGWDGFGYLFDAAGTVIASDDDAGGFGHPKLAGTLAAGRYFYCECSFSNNLGSSRLEFTLGGGATLATGPWLQFDFEEGSGTSIADSAGNGNTGVLAGRGAWIAGKIGSGAIDCGGPVLSDGPPVAFPLNILPIEGHGVAAWVDFYGAGDGVVIGDLGGHYAMYLDGTDWYYSVGLGKNVAIPHGGLGGWKHMAVSRAQLEVSFYIDGALLGTRTLAGGDNDPLKLSTLGAYSNNANPADAKLDDFRLYNRTLTADEVLALFEAGASSATTVEIIGSGGAVAGGSALRARRRAAVASGGALAGGTALRSRRRVVVATGGLVAGGAAGAVRRLARVGAGGARLGGAAAVGRHAGFIASGGLRAGGAAVTAVLSSGARDSASIDAALIARLLSDAALLALMPDGVFLDEAPPGAQRFVIVALLDEHDVAAFGGRAYEDGLYLVEARALSTTSGNVRAAAKRIDALLEDRVWTIAGYTLMASFREARVTMTEVDPVDPDIRWTRRGGHYRIQASLI